MSDKKQIETCLILRKSPSIYTSIDLSLKFVGTKFIYSGHMMREWLHGFIKHGSMTVQG